MSTTPTTCPHCGAEEVKQLLRNWSGWSCGTHGPTGAPDLVTIKPPCYERQISALKAELEDALNKAVMLESGKYGVRHLSGQKMDLEAKLKALNAELEQAKAERQWRPIETAPKDGTGIDVWIGGAAGFRIANVYWYQGGWHTFKTSSGSPIFSPLGWEEIASLWMPLPTAPKEAKP